MASQQQPCKTLARQHWCNASARRLLAPDLSTGLESQRSRAPKLVGSIMILKHFRIINFAATIAFKRNNSITPTRFGRLSNHQHRYAASVSVSHRDSTQDCPNLLLQNDLARQRPNDSFLNSHASTVARRESLRTLACFMHTELQSCWINHFDASTAHKNAHQLQSAHRHQNRSDALPHYDVEAFRIRGTA